MPARLAGRLLVLLAVLGAVACGGGGGDGESGTRPTVPPPAVTDEPCLLVDKAVVDEALAAEMSRGMGLAEANALPAVGLIGVDLCVFKSAQPGGPTVQVGITSAFPRQVFDKYKADPVNRPLAPVAQLGNEAVWFERNNTLVVLHGDVVFAVYVFAPQAPNRQQVATTLAQAILERL